MEFLAMTDGIGGYSKSNSTPEACQERFKQLTNEYDEAVQRVDEQQKDLDDLQTLQDSSTAVVNGDEGTNSLNDAIEAKSNTIDDMLNTIAKDFDADAESLLSDCKDHLSEEQKAILNGIRGAAAEQTNNIEVDWEMVGKGAAGIAAASTPAVVIGAAIYLLAPSLFNRQQFI
jgi:ABC-type transporter Mla subunit MlaD